LADLSFFTNSVLYTGRNGVENGGLMVGNFYSAPPVNPNNGQRYESDLRVHSVHDYQGGTDGFVQSGIASYLEFRPGNHNSGWSILGVARTTRDGVGGMVGVYGQSISEGGSSRGSWAGCFENRWLSENNSVPVGGIGIEVDMFAPGVDNNEYRIGVDIIAGNGTTDRSTPQGRQGVGLRIGSFNGDSEIGMWRKGIKLNQRFEVGIDLTDAVIEQTAIRLGEAHKIGFDSVNARYMRYAGGSLDTVMANGFGTTLHDDGWFRVPQRPGDPSAPEGSIYYDTITGRFRVRDRSGWHMMALD
jgi:hypothetical protein